MRQDVSFSPQEERAIEELAAEYRKLLRAREGRTAHAFRKVKLPGALSGKAGRVLSCALLGLSLLCLAAVLSGLCRAVVHLPAQAQFTASSDDIPDRQVPVSAQESAEGLIPINTAGADQLVLLPGVGPVLAERIIEERDRNGAFRLPEDLLSVRGIGASTLEKILPLITLQEPE